MSEKVLSQDEVDAILGGVESGEIETGQGVGSGEGVRPYDFKVQERVIRGRMPGLELANDRFTRLFRNSLASIIMKFIDVRIHNVEMMAFSEFMKTLPLPASINLFKMEPLKGFALFVIEAPMVFGFIEYFFGGGSKPYVKSEGKYFTPIEQRMIKKVAALALKDMAASWSSLVQMTPEYVGLEMNPQFVTIVTASESVIKIDIEIEVEDFSGRCFFCIPYSMVEPIKDKLYSGIQLDKQKVDQRWVDNLKAALADSRVRLRAEMGRVQLSVGELMDLDVGNVITEKARGMAEIPALISGGIKAFAPGTGKKAIALVGPTGVGKTTTIAKLAARAVKEGRRVAMVNLDTYRIGAIEQIRIYSKILGVPLDIVSDSEGLKNSLAKYAGRDAVFIDTTGRNPRSGAHISELGVIYDSGFPVETHLLMSLNSDDAFLRDSYRYYGMLPVDCLAFTKADEAVRFGSIYNLSTIYQKPVAYVTTGQRVPEDIEFPSSERLVDLILKCGGEMLEKLEPFEVGSRGDRVHAACGVSR